MIENTNTKQFYPGPILNDTLEISEFLFNTVEQIKIKHSKFDENGVLRDVDLIYGQDYEVLKDEALTCDDGSEPPSHAHIMEMGLTASTGQITLKEHIHVIAGERLTAYRESAIIQDKNYPRTGAFPAATHEGALDYLTMQNQEQQDELDRALKVPISTQNFAGSMPLPVPGRALKINQDGSGFEMSEFDPDIALTTTENFRNEAQQFASEATLSASSAKSSETIASQKVNEITVLHNNYTENITNLSEDYKQQIDIKSTNYLNQINSRGDTIIKDADAIINRVGFNLFDTVIKDHLLTYEESIGLALQGTWVYHDAIAGERYGYPDFYNKVVEEFEQATPRNFIYNDTISWTVYDAPNGHMYVDVSEKSKIDTCFEALGMAWYYILDRANKRVFLPRNNWFEQMSMTQAGKWVVAGLPNITGDLRTFVDLGRSAGSGAIRRLDDGTDYLGTSTAAGTRYAGFSFNASLSNSIYGNSNTVQPNAVKKLLYICVGNTVSDTSWVDVVTQVESGVKDLEDKKNTSIAEIDANAKSYDNLTNRQITNCLLEVPQRIKLELNNGTLTLKAGSEVIVPNGFEADGTTPKFDEVVIENDVQLLASLTSAYTDGDYSWCYNKDLNKIQGGNNKWNQIQSNTYDNSVQYCMFYDSINNIIKYTADSGTTWETGYSLPFTLTTLTNGTGIISIDQVFNGFGYIGSHFWVNKGVKALAPNTRNIDETLKNYEITTTQISIYTRNLSGDTPLWLNANGTLFLSAGIAYDEKRNVIYSKTEVNQTTVRCQVAMTNLTNGVVKLFQPKQPFRALDASSTPYITETYIKGTSWYRVWSDGWCEQGGRISGLTAWNGETALLKIYRDKNYALNATISRNNFGASADAYNYFISAEPLTNYSFIWATVGHAGTQAFRAFQWQANGYIA